jgi:hypothetical protein
VSVRVKVLRFGAAAAAVCLAPVLVVAFGSTTPAGAATLTTAWQNGGRWAASRSA